MARKGGYIGGGTIVGTKQLPFRGPDDWREEVISEEPVQLKGEALLLQQDREARLAEKARQDKIAEKQIRKMKVVLPVQLRLFAGKKRKRKAKG